MLDEFKDNFLILNFYKSYKSMDIKYFFKNTEIDNETRNYIEKRLSTLEKLLNKIIKTEVEVGKDKRGMYRVEVMITVPKNKFRAEEISESVEASVDIVVDELKTQIRRKKEKVWTKLIRKARSFKKKTAIDEDARF